MVVSLDSLSIVATMQIQASADPAKMSVTIADGLMTLLKSGCDGNAAARRPLHPGTEQPYACFAQAATPDRQSKSHPVGRAAAAGSEIKG